MARSALARTAVECVRFGCFGLVSLGCGHPRLVDTAEDMSLQEWRGMLVWGHEVREFRSCDSEEAFWVVDETGDLWDRYREVDVGSEPYSRIFVVLRGRLEPPPVEGFGADYPATIRVCEIVSMEPETGECSTTNPVQ